ncbi:MAG: CPBP family intramembrane metalloprotease [Prolixibacteraceae bacterium]|nr:CPBP family intramembrane metalloprotease [Prolixibacteraceae bacterium]MBN2773144.1 CPBP family intramembrane metalloprotease [Prolixibacteraceae bacterium]
MEQNNNTYMIKLFFVILTILTTVVFVWMFNNLQNKRSIAMLMMWIPGISAFITSAVTGENIRSYGWRPGKLKYLGWAYILPFAIAIVVYGIVWLSGIAEFTPDEVRNYRWARYLGFETPAPFWIGFVSKAVIYTITVSVLTLGEEIGWSGFLTPRLLKLHSVPVTGIFVGLIWSVWHYPAIIGGVYGYNAPLWIALPGFSLVLIGNSIIKTALIARSKSLWVGVLLHSSHNIILMSMFWEMTVKTKYTSYWVSETGILTAVIYLIAGYLFWKQMKHQETDLFNIN